MTIEKSVFENKDDDGKRKLIIEELAAVFGYYLHQISFNEAAWENIDLATQISIIKYIFSTETFHMSGDKNIVKAAVCGLELLPTFSKRFFGNNALPALIKDVLNCSDIEMRKDFLHTMASSSTMIAHVPEKEILFNTLTERAQSDLLFASFIPGSEISIIQVAAQYNNVNFIIMMLEIRQNLKNDDSKFFQQLKKSLDIMYSPDNQQAVINIKKWLKENNLSSFEANLLKKIDSLLESNSQEEEFDSKDEIAEQPAKKLKPS